MLLLNWGWIGIALVSLVAGFIGGCQHERKEFDLYKASMQATAEAQQRQAQAINESNKQKSKEIASEYQRRIDAIRASYRGLHNYGSNTMPGQAKAASGVDASTTYDVLAESCAETTQQLVSLQDFIKETQ